MESKSHTQVDEKPMKTPVVRKGRAPLNPQMATFAYNVAIGMTHTQAARAAGYAFPGADANRLLRTPAVIERITSEQAKFEAKADVSRQKVIDGLKEAIDVARIMSDPNAMVAGWREIARICGYYAPERKQLDITVAGAVQISQITDMTDEELAKLITNAEFVRVPNDEDVPALPSPEETLDHAGD